ncbi:MAG: zinc-dependent metalloprotease [Flavisolibacter sp.]
MRLKNGLFLLLASLSVLTSGAQESLSPKTESSKQTAYAEVGARKVLPAHGLFSVHKTNDKYFFEIPDSLLNREFLFTTRLVKVPTGSPMFGGELVNSIIVSFEKATEDRLYLRVVTNVAVADSSDAIAKAVRNSSIDPIVMVLDIKSRNKSTNSSVVDVTDFILKDNNITGFDPLARKNMYLGGGAPDRSFILSMNSFDQNIEIKTVKTFSLGAVQKQGAEAGEAAAPGPSASVTMELNNSIMLLPNIQMQARYADPRVGYYSESYKVFSDEQQRVEEKDFIVRQRLEPKPEDMEKYKRGELVEPKDPIVYYVDPATPKQWRPYIIAGINDWNEAFKAAGFKNAIIGREWPENDTTMSLEDGRCKVVRYFPSSQDYSYAPRIYDPRSGEVLQTYIGWSHNKMQSLHDWYFVQAAAIDPGARSMKFSKELMGSLIRADISRQVGLSLGLKANLIGSNAYPVEKLRDRKWLEANGFTASIMDFVHYNYVAQPGDQISFQELIPHIGEYDKWAIKYGYTYTGCNDFEKDKKEALIWINKEQSKNPALKFQTTLDASPNDPSDPRAQTEDLSNNTVKASEYGIGNLKIVMAHLLQWTREDMDMYDDASRTYDNLMDWWLLMARHVFTQVGGVREDLKTVEQTGDVYTTVSKDMQKQAVAYLQKEVFNTPEWLLDPNVLNKFSKPSKREKVQRFQEEALYQLMKSDRLYRMTTETMRYGKENTYTMDELLTDIDKGLWSELRSAQPLISSDRRLLQKKWIDNMRVVMKDASVVPQVGSTMPDLTGTDVPAIIRVHMQNIMQQCKQAASRCKDPMTLAHLQYAQAKLAKMLDNKN